MDSTDQTVHCSVMNRENKEEFYITFVYGHNDLNKRIAMWIRRYSTAMRGAWCVLGDFNVVLHIDDRIGGSRVTREETKDFEECLRDCGLEEVPYTGSYYTWSNKQGLGDRIYSKLDRVVSNVEWVTKFGSKTIILEEGISDHCPLIIPNSHCQIKRNEFKYCEMWRLDPSFQAIIKEGWSKQVVGRPMFQILQKLKSLKAPLRKLNRDKFHQINKQVEVIGVELEEIQKHLKDNLEDSELLHKEKQLAKEYHLKIKAALLLRKQQSKMEWITEADQDDLIVICRADEKSIKCVMESLAHFKKTIGLSINLGKSQIVMAGINHKEKKRLIEMTKITEGKLPFTYLGCPITTSKMSSADCDLFIEKITSRITSWATKHLSYAGRSRLINSVLFGIINFWCRIFIIPGRVMKKVQALCRNYLWGAAEKYKRVPLVNWEDTCKPKGSGGLGFRNVNVWNKALVMKLNWDIANKKDNLWVRWIHSRYIKGTNFWDYTPKQDTCYYWRRMVKVRAEFEGMRINGEYTPEEGYQWLLGQPPKAEWASVVWNRLTIPKHQFNMWLILKNRLQTRQRLSKFINVDTKCLLCNNGAEDINHLFWECPFSKELHSKIMVPMGCVIQASSFQEYCDKMRRHGTIRERGIWIAAWATTCYFIWKARNTKWHLKEDVRVDECVSCIMFNIRCFISSKLKKSNILSR
ncbi:unnamed protein product [Cuscuta campestris]|uniref:Reverse transcriptase zinc-binding domain-containing protein n=1 Tax=Cuscuta campestris TaxID=132261 RepID=A0A484LHE0_9ASTE|nr:unnamed protein product [Cuscuta campestris]